MPVSDRIAEFGSLPARAGSWMLTYRRLDAPFARMRGAFVWDSAGEHRFSRRVLVASGASRTSPSGRESLPPFRCSSRGRVAATARIVVFLLRPRRGGGTKRAPCRAPSSIRRGQGRGRGPSTRRSRAGDDPARRGRRPRARPAVGARELCPGGSASAGRSRLPPEADLKVSDDVGGRGRAAGCWASCRAAAAVPCAPPRVHINHSRHQ